MNRSSPQSHESRPSLSRVFEAERPRLVGLAYRITGSRLDAEDIVQDAWLRAQRAEWSDVEHPAAWLTTIVSRLAFDDLKSARHRRETYVGPWLPEPVLAPARETSDPADEVELAETLTFGFLRLLETLSPVERVVFLLADVFAMPFSEIAQVVERSPDACRQVAIRARRAVRSGGRPRHDLPDEAAQVARDLFVAMTAGDVDQVVSLLADDVVFVSDGGAEARAARRVVRGPRRVGRLVVNLSKRHSNGGLGGAEVTGASINGAPGLVARRDGQLFLATTIQVVDGHVQAIYAVTNPHKLAALQITDPLV